MRPLLNLAVIVLCGGLASCSFAGGPTQVEATAVVVPASLTTAGPTSSPPLTPTLISTASPAAPADSTPAAGASDDYQIGPLDVLEVSVFQVPDLSKTVQVSANGLISLPLIGTVQASGKTVAELEADITQKYGSTYLQSPQVSVFIHDALSQRITVNGEVNKPGVYPTEGPTTLMQAVALAGGLTDLAGTQDVLVLRTVAGKREAAKFDLAAVQAGTADDPPVRGGDTIVVDRSGAKAAWKGLRESIPVFGAFVPLL